ncbi:unnamed protein product [Prorocentrum cordatum]|uniref:Helicase C-terminal domain-containing protein n=1 Tax=Prorocentrum cordatum TaxID=2364126 RepID=A0ABN9PM39_9DINO|nr:unnamed protein product [Polarella glacialis]
MVSAQLRHAVDEAWTVLRSRSSASPLDILVHLLDPKQDDKVISHYRESFSKLLCAQMALERVRNQSILLLSPEELSSVKEAVESQGPCRLHSKVVLAGGALPPGVVIQSWVRWDGQELHREPQAVTSTGGLPGAFDGPLVLEYSSSGSTAPDSDDDLRDRAYVALVFLPGLSMVSDFQYALQSHPGPPADEVFALHGKVRQEDQMAAVRPIESGCRVILSTNVAESSITVPNADAVVDLCLARTMRWNEDRLGQLLDLDAATKDSLGQRAGRVGRTKAGLVLRMISREEFDGLSSGRLPEMLRRPVDKVMLKIVNMSPAGYEGGVDVESEIQACLSPPEGDKIKEALEQLLAAHAIEPVGDDGRRFRALRLGLLLEDLPMDLRLGLLVAWGVEAGLEHAAVDAAVMLQAHNVVGEPRSTLLDCGRAFIQHCATLRRFADGFPSDAVMLVNVLRAFRAESRSVGWVAGDACLRAADRMRHWCRDNGVNFASIQTVDDTVRAIHERVSVVVPSRQDSDAARIWEQLPCQELPAEESSILMVLFCGAFHRHALQVRNPTRATFLHGTYDQGWGDSEVVIHWDGVDLRRHELIQDRVAGFFSRGSCGIFGQCVNSGREGTAGGWARIALEPRSGNMTFGFPVEVSNVLKLQRDFAKLCDLGENVQVQIEHAASTKLVPIFWRWEDLTEKRQDVVVQVSSVAGPYLEPRPLSQQRCHAAVFCAKFDSFHTKTQKRWQKGETLTLLPHCGEAGEPREGPSLSELVLLIFGVRPRALAASEAPQGSGDGAGMALLGTPGLRPRLAAGRGALADGVYRSLCGPRCVLQEFGGSTHAEWRTQTGSVRRLLCSLLDRFGGPEALRALAWPRRAREAPEGLAAAARAAPGSDVSDGDLAESESEGGQDLPEGARSPVPASRGVCVVVDLDCWLAEHGCHSGPEEAAALFEAMLGYIQEQVGQEVVHVTARGSELAGACGQAGGLGPAAVADAVRRLVGPGKADVSVDSQHAGTRGPADAAKELGCELAFCALSYVRGAGPQASLSPHPAHLVLVLGPGLSSVLRHLTAQRTRPRFWATASPVHEERLRRLHPDVGLIRPFAPPAAASSNRDTQQTQMAEPEQESEPVLGRGEKFGRVKSFNASRDPAYGFVAGGQHGQDIYLPGKNCEAGYVPSPGDLVIFKEGKQKNGKPVANDDNAVALLSLLARGIDPDEEDAIMGEPALFEAVAADAVAAVALLLLFGRTPPESGRHTSASAADFAPENSEAVKLLHMWQHGDRAAVVDNLVPFLELLPPGSPEARLTTPWPICPAAATVL